MPAARPAGSDGSDHAYREKVENYYKSLPVWRAAGWLLLHFTFVPTILKVIWALVPFHLLGLTRPEFPPFVMLACWVMAMIMWSLALPATYKERLSYIKLTNVFIMVGTVLEIVNFWKYYMITPAQQHWPRRVWKHLNEEAGWHDDRWLTFFKGFEATVDGVMFLSWICTTACLHSYIVRAMEKEKRFKAAKLSAGGQDDVKPLPAGVTAKAGAVRRRPGRA